MTHTNPHRARGGIPRREEIPRDWIEAADGLLQTVEALAWELRSAGLRGAAVWRDIERRGALLASQLHETRRELSFLPARVSRITRAGLALGTVASSYRLHRTRAAFLSEASAAAALESLHARNARRFHQLAALHGGGFTKVGQLLSARADLLPDTWVHELSKLQDAAPAFPFEAARAMLEEDLGGPLHAHFSAFEEEPFAAASIGQVHRATTNEGTRVAVKIRRPGIEDWIAIDLDLLELTLDALQPALPPTDFETIRSEVREMVLGELDYEAEAAAMERLADFFGPVPGVCVPRPQRMLCGERVLVSELSDGRKITGVLDALRARAAAGDAEAERRIGAILGRLLEAYLRQIFHAGVVQADPHPGNLLVDADDGIVLLDFGCARRISRRRRERYLDLVLAAIVRDRDRMGACFRSLGFATQSGDPETLHRYADALLREFRLAARGGERIRWLPPEEILARAAALLDQSRTDPVERLPADFVMLARVFGVLGGLFHHYRPRIDYARYVLPVLASARGAPSQDAL